MNIKWQELNPDTYGTILDPKEVTKPEVTKEVNIEVTKPIPIPEPKPTLIKDKDKEDKDLNSNFSTNLKRILAGVGEYNKSRLLEASAVSGSRAPAVSAGSSNTNTGANLSSAVANSIQARKQPSITYYDKLLGSFK